VSRPGPTNAGDNYVRPGYHVAVCVTCGIAFPQSRNAAYRSKQRKRGPYCTISCSFGVPPTVTLCTAPVPGGCDRLRAVATKDKDGNPTGRHRFCGGHKQRLKKGQPIDTPMLTKAEAMRITTRQRTERLRREKARRA
jgi:hypothetical protein